METTTIENEQDYQKTLQRIDMLMDAKKGSPEFEELMALTELVEDYEDKLCS